MGGPWPQTMRLTAFDLREIEADRQDANGLPIFRHKRGLRAVLARLGDRWDAAWARANPEAFQRPSDRA